MEKIEEITKEVCKELIEPIERDIEDKGLYIPETLSKLGELGFFSVSFPREFGGVGLTFEEAVKSSIILSSYTSTLSMIIGAHQLASFSIFLFGSDMLKEKYLLELNKGKLIGAFSLTEPHAGSDPSAIKTTAVLDSDYYILNGTKAFVTNAGLANLYVIFAKTNPESGARGITAFVVEGNTPGLAVGHKEEKMALPYLPNATVTLKDVKVPKENVIGRANLGFIVAMKTLELGRILTAAGSVGLMERALRESIKYAKERTQGGQPIANYQMIQSYLAEMKTLLETSREIVLTASRKKDLNASDLGLYSSIAKYYATKSAVDVTRLATQIFGGYGYVRGYTVERLYREAKMYEIVEGTNEIQKLIIANQILKG
ncbi:acyl-CoA dehydrogenase family protein [Caldisericum exile]|uniref:Acyl-CoA dehydrogenase n=1 Tax=Caldisericum exile (strain DSM 21853 / NBRC 104410 / AZM16c01) TaxID=511051 RepID=A0A7U6GG05_CALEA|nr:acyl-CoA dehydrogenase family protein [Caldisericum exile]BAL81627.1 acyl-CoA dehydrogenase [Caldisericum exile AZM16c01]